MRAQPNSTTITKSRSRGRARHIVLVLAFCVLVGLQGLSLAARSLLILWGHPEFALEEEHPGEGI